MKSAGKRTRVAAYSQFLYSKDIDAERGWSRWHGLRWPEWPVCFSPFTLFRGTAEWVKWRMRQEFCRDRIMIEATKKQGVIMSIKRFAPFIPFFALLLIGMIAVISGCAGQSPPPDSERPDRATSPSGDIPADEPGTSQLNARDPGSDLVESEREPGSAQSPNLVFEKPSESPAKDNSVPPATPEPTPQKRSQQNSGILDRDGTIHVVANPQDVAVLVNKNYRLPDNFRPDDLVEPNIPFIFKEKSEKRLLRKEAARALEELFAGAKEDGIYLAGVSGFRSHSTQKWLFENYVKTRGEAEARRFSAMPGHSEHQTGLAMDVAGSDGKCAAQDCFGDTKEAKWLADHAHEYGFIIRYPKGKEAVTGYKYEPWHLRYVGKGLAQAVVGQNLTLDEYLQRTVPVSN